ncbi:YiiD C-terminal domain-containing protein [Pseudoxanthomonas sp. F37]|jgi:thioesterase domain-containing protein|uniref:YiiD C-terminal domain-containing protein n=1 Tax=Pseudoxanthomonas TaxID=83618 RepID=UPI001FD033D0|nr:MULTISPECIES: YiiD C-terminal domain-containing protein [Pseudoxanthomonas]UOV03739.1 YiiD C-terminal domain-containing protein [Pseudoxanthomonas mexicana]UOV08735.1 YiiD C-terminal domain-containing protein [Pseudoxanthomonas sp. F37]
MSLEEALQELREYCRGMPPVAAMQVDVEGMRGDALRLTAPLSANVNDKGNAFGGSLTSLMTVAGWGLVTLKLRLAGLKAEVYVADSQIRYLAPLYDDLVAEAVLAEGQAWDVFVDTLVQRGRARVQLDARVLLPEGGLATTLSGRYVAIAKR